jgi:hypothetical protein
VIIADFFFFLFFFHFLTTTADYFKYINQVLTRQEQRNNEQERQIHELKRKLSSAIRDIDSLCQYNKFPTPYPTRHTHTIGTSTFFFFFFFYAINAILYLINKIKQKVRKYIVMNTKAEANHANAKF